MKKILYVASECVPFVKTGGLADVVGALPKNFDKKDYDVRVMLPNYRAIDPKYRETAKCIYYFQMDLVQYYILHYQVHHKASLLILTLLYYLNSTLAN